MHRVRFPLAGAYLKVTQKMKTLEPDLTSAMIEPMPGEYEMQWFRHDAVPAALEAGWHVPDGKRVESHHTAYSALLWRPVGQEREK